MKKSMKIVFKDISQGVAFKYHFLYVTFLRFFTLFLYIFKHGKRNTIDVWSKSFWKLWLLCSIFVPQNDKNNKKHKISKKFQRIFVFSFFFTKKGKNFTFFAKLFIFRLSQENQKNLDFFYYFRFYFKFGNLIRKYSAFFLLSIFVFFEFWILKILNRIWE